MNTTKTQITFLTVVFAVMWLFAPSARATFPPGDVCEEALAVGNVTNLPFDTTGARFGGRGLCMRSPNIWFCYTAECTGDVTVSLAGSSYDTMLAVYEGCQCFPTVNDLLACNDDFGGTYQSQVTFTAKAGNQYLIEVGGYGSLTGKGQITIQCEGAFGVEKPDLGDAPDSSNRTGTTMHAYNSQGMLPYLVPAHFPTVFDDASGNGPYGPFHINTEPVAYLGRKITAETEADSGFDQDGQTNILPNQDRADLDSGDEGLMLPLTLPACGWASIDYEVTVVNPNVPLWVNIWLDWNRDGDWDDSVDCPEGSVPEWAVKNQFLAGLPEGLNQISTPGFLCWHPQEHELQEVWLRITLSEQPWVYGSNPGEIGNAGSGPQAKYEIGETEDYFITPEPGQDKCPLCQDINSDGLTDIQDLVLLVSEWLDTCLTAASE